MAVTKMQKAVCEASARDQIETRNSRKVNATRGTDGPGAVLGPPRSCPHVSIRGHTPYQ